MKLHPNREAYFKSFIRFLKENGAFASYVKAMSENNRHSSDFVDVFKKNKEDFFNYCDINNWITHSFIWSDTKLGGDFWRILNSKWVNYKHNIL